VGGGPGEVAVAHRDVRGPDGNHLLRQREGLRKVPGRPLAWIPNGLQCLDQSRQDDGWLPKVGGCRLGLEQNMELLDQRIGQVGVEVPSSKDRRRLEVPSYLHERLLEIAETEDRTVASVLGELLFMGLSTYEPAFVPSKHLARFNERARRVLDAAREEAHAFNHNYLGTEHLLLGLLREDEGVAARVLTTLGVTLETVRRAVEGRIGRGDAPATQELDYVPRARRVLGLALDEARGMGFVRTEHILLAIVREGGGIAADILDSFGVLGVVREATLTRLGQPPESVHAQPS